MSEEIQNPTKKLCCFNCGSQKNLLVKETVYNGDEKIVLKQFICSKCAGMSNE